MSEQEVKAGSEGVSLAIKIPALVLGVLFMLYVGLVTVFVVGSDRLIYAPVATPFVGDGETVEVGAIPVTILRADSSKGSVLFLQGNTGSRAALRETMDAYRVMGFDVVSFPYPGAEGRPGRMNQDQMMREALFVFDAIPGLLGEQKPVFVHGYSMGGALGLSVVARREAAGLVLQAPLVSMCAILAHRFSVPACVLKGDKWDMNGVVGWVDEPVLIVHGSQDSIVPPSQARELEGDLVGARSVRRVEYPDLGHAGFSKTPYIQDIKDWVDEVMALPVTND